VSKKTLREPDCRKPIREPQFRQAGLVRTYMIESKARMTGRARKKTRRGITLKNTWLFLGCILIVINNL